MIRVLIIDDSALVREALRAQLRRDPEIQVVGTAPDPYAGRDLIVRTRPSVVTLDLEMPRMNGLTFLAKLMRHHPLPVIVVSSLTPRGSHAALRALELGAVEVLCKPRNAQEVNRFGNELVRRVKAAAQIRPEKLHALRVHALATLARPEPGAPGAPTPQAPPRASALPGYAPDPGKVVLIGASTGGTQAIEELLGAYPADGPGTLIIQHMPAAFTAAFAERLHQICAMEVREATHGDAVRPGRALVAPGDRHLLLLRGGARYSVQIQDGPRVHYQRPSVEVAFNAAARHAGAAAVGVLLTGMGDDGAHGLLRMRAAGAHTIAQDEATAVVFGMPRRAIELGAAERVLALGEIPRAILTWTQQRRAAA